MTMIRMMDATTGRMIRMIRLLLFIVVIVVASVGSSNGENIPHKNDVLDPVILPIPDSSRPRFANYSRHPRTERDRVSVNLVHTNYAWSVVAPSDRSLEKTSRQAKEHGCDIAATNGGPFHADGSSCGPVVIRGQLLENTNNITATTNMVGFGTSKHNEWLLGKYQQFASSDVYDFVTGFGWLVYDGEVVADNTDNPTGAVRAARTAIGLNDANDLLLFVADGCEKCLWNRGFTLEELAQTLVANVGARYAINMDGGGSSTMVYEEQVVNRPTCLDIPIIVCQRPVASVMCVSGFHHQRYQHHHHPMEAKETERNNVPKE